MDAHQPGRMRGTCERTAGESRHISLSALALLDYKGTSGRNEDSKINCNVLAFVTLLSPRWPAAQKAHPGIVQIGLSL